MPKIIFQPLMICNPPSKNVRPLIPGGFVIPQQKKKHTPLLRISNPQSLNRLGPFLTPDFKSGGTPSGHLRILRIPSLLAARPEKAKALKMRPFCNISVKVLDLHQEIGGF